MIKSDMTDVTLEFFFFEHTLWLKNKLYLRFIEFTIKFIRYLKILKIKKHINGKQEGINYYNDLTKLLNGFLHSFGHHTDVYVDEYIKETEHYTTTMAAQFVEHCQKEYMQASKKVN